MDWCGIALAQRAKGVTRRRIYLAISCSTGDQKPFGLEIGFARQRVARQSAAEEYLACRQACHAHMLQKLSVQCDPDDLG